MNMNNVKKTWGLKLRIVLPGLFLMAGLATPILAQQENRCEDSPHSQEGQTEREQSNPRFSGVFHLLDANKNPLSGVAYQVIEPNGKIMAHGLTDQDGKTVTVYSDEHSEAKILITLGDWKMDESVSRIEEIASIEEPDDADRDKLCPSLGAAEIAFETYYTPIKGLRFRFTTPKGDIFPGETSPSGWGGTLVLHNQCEEPLYFVDSSVFSEPVREISSPENIMPMTVEIFTDEGNWRNIGSFKLESGKVNTVAVRIDMREYPFSLCPVF